MSRARSVSKPGYSLTRSAFWISFILAWAMMAALVLSALAGQAQAVALAGIAFPSLVVLVAALLGIHRAFGSLDMQTIAGATYQSDDEEERP